MLNKVHRIELLKCFQKRKNSSLERKLTEYILQKGPRLGLWHDHELATGISLLCKIGGTGITEVVNTWLRTDSRYGRLDATQGSLLSRNLSNIPG